jgi:hypothetical protein
MSLACSRSVSVSMAVTASATCDVWKRPLVPATSSCSDVAAGVTSRCCGCDLLIACVAFEVGVATLAALN